MQRTFLYKTILGIFFHWSLCRNGYKVCVEFENVMKSAQKKYFDCTKQSLTSVSSRKLVISQALNNNQFLHSSWSRSQTCLVNLDSATELLICISISSFQLYTKYILCSSFLKDTIWTVFLIFGVKWLVGVLSS